MAKVVFGDGRQMSGSLGASTYMRDGRVRRRTNPANVVSARKTQVQGNLAQLAVEWRTLTDAQREAWRGVVTRVNALGATITLSPIAAYCAVNAALMACNEDGVVIPPGFDSGTMITIVGSDTDTAADPEDARVRVQLQNDSGASRKVLIDATPPISPGITNFVNKLRQIGCFAAAAGAVNVDITAEYLAVMGGLACAPANVGKKIGFRVCDLNAGNPILVGTTSGILLAEAP